MCVTNRSANEKRGLLINCIYAVLLAQKKSSENYKSKHWKHTKHNIHTTLPADRAPVPMWRMWRTLDNSDTDCFA